jgi:acyl-CoA synthetase (AMP-forming)/AMP-acid ligase II/thioesterase domain-containing protein
LQGIRPGKTGDYLDLEKWAAQTPDTIALAAPGRDPLTYSGLSRHVFATSEAFLRAGIRSSGVVALALPNGPEFVTATLAITLRSACAPLDLSLTRDEYRSYLPRIGASTLIFEAGKNGPVVEVARELKMRLIGIGSSPEAPAGVSSIDNVEGSDHDMPGRQTDAAFLLLTSATTDIPKLVPWTRANVRAAVSQDSRALEMTAADRFLSLMPLCHASGLYTLLTHLFSGGSVYCPSSFEMASFLEALQEFRPTSFSAGPAVHRIVLAHAQQDPEFFRRIPLRYVRSAGAPPQAGMLAKLEELFGAPVLDSYGLTEMVGATRSTPTLRKPGSVGKAIDGEMAIIDDSGRPQPPETEGEVVIRGPMLMSGYLDDPEANQSAFIQDGWFRTGDIGRLDHEGYLFLVGRRKEIINRGGKKISLPEVDNALATHPAVVEVAAFAIPHRTLGEDVAAAVVLHPKAAASELDLRRFAAESLASHKVPRKIVFVQNIPRTSLGKAKRSVLAERFGDLSAAAPSRPPASSDARKPSNAELRLIQIWRGVLGIEKIEIEDNFFELGGDSLTAALMLAEASQSFNIGQHLVPEAEFFDQPSVAALARMLEECARQTGKEQRLPNRLMFLRNAGSRIPFFCFSTTTLDPHRFRHLSQSLGPYQPFIVVCPSPAVQDNRRLDITEVARQCVVSIRALRDHGPYFLGGYCYGGVVAFETALQLTAAGEEVALLALFDTPTPGYPKIARQWKSYIRRGVALLRSLTRGKVPIATPDLAAHLRTLVRMAAERRSASANPALASADAANSRTDDEWNGVLMREYVPRVLSSPIVHFCASDDPVSTQVLSDPRLGWRDFAGAGFESHMVAGDHVSMLEETNSPALAAMLEKVLEAAGSKLDRQWSPETISYERKPDRPPPNVGSFR